MDCAGSPDGVSGYEEQPECYGAISTTLIRQHRQRVCGILCKKETTEGEAVTLQVRVNFFQSFFLLHHCCFNNREQNWSCLFVLSCPLYKPVTFFFFFLQV